MAGKITEEQKVLINELYYKYGVKARVARELGISATSVSKYIVPDYIPKEKRVIDLKPIETEPFAPNIIELVNTFIANFSGGDIRKIVLLTNEERTDLNRMQEGEIF